MRPQSSLRDSVVFLGTYPSTSCWATVKRPYGACSARYGKKDARRFCPGPGSPQLGTTEAGNALALVEDEHELPRVIHIDVAVGHADGLAVVGVGDAFDLGGVIL